MKKFLAAMLAFAMVVTGLYLVAPTAKAAVDTSMLSVDAQLETKGGSEVIRLVSSVDSLDYKSVGFDITYPDNTTDTIELNKVFQKIVSNTDTEYNLSPKAISSVSEYFITAKVAANASGNYTVRAYAIAKDNTKIVGTTRCFSVADLKGDSISITVPAQLDKSKTYTATYGSNKEGTGATAASVTVLTTAEGSSNVRIVLAENAKATSLKSLTKFVINEGTTKVAEGLYRNYKTTHVPAEGTTPVADTSWYDVNPEAEEFIIATSADLYGFAAIQNATTAVNWDTNTHFTLPKVTLVGDITINKGTATASGWTPAQGEQEYLFTPIGEGYYQRFSGVFDGDGNTINGLVIKDSTYATGLFAMTYRDSTTNTVIGNFNITNSYIEGSYDVGSVVGLFYGGTIENVYSDAHIKATITTTTYGFVGGMVGEIAVKDVEYTIKNCWFNGSAEGQSYVGGMLARCNLTGTKVYITNCLYTGTVNALNNYAGGMYAFTNQYGSTYITNSISMGTITSANASPVLGSMVAQTNSSKGYFFFKPGCYTTIPETTMEIISKQGSYAGALGNAATEELEGALVAPTGYYTTANALASSSVADLFPTYEGVSSSADWAKATVAGTANMPIPACFAAWWNAQ